ncbi:ATP-binding protein [Allonocardiopsis opalescens]|uniref:Anti-sigma regulatory factor (Ser/Thr protein kinase) n=1 Tax=Allonocardiopsis opalescens TaxID=1144618 RepID=A0A2T0Q6M5_9ACTN|nr:ATP-binding protein [Allonocardiopsis opalescens]PRX99465.1 anti-sigma regulatory factor (Ser/Thr protein kinase) [Allonocardiopsis opalescens]
MATVELTISALPAHVRTARLLATAVARRLGIGDPTLDEIRLAVGEACSRAVEAHRRSSPAEPIRLELIDHAGRYEVVVHDRVPSAADSGPAESGPGQDPIGDLLSPDVGLAVIMGLADRADIEPSADGTVVTMSWPTPARPESDAVGVPHRRSPQPVTPDS